MNKNDKGIIMIKNKKQFRFGLAILILITSCYIGFQYYSNHKKKEDYKRFIVSELKSGLWFIEEVFSKDLDFLKKKIDSDFRPFLEENSNLNEQELWRLREHINRSFIDFELPSEYLRDEYWESSKQSGILSQFSIRELEQLNLAYSRREKLIETEKIVQKFGFNSPSFSITFSREISKTELEIIRRKYKNILSDYSSIARRTSYRYYNAMGTLDPENKYLRHLDSLKLTRN